MWLKVRMEDVPSITILVSKKKSVTHSWWDSTSPSQWGKHTTPPTFSWQRRRWQTSQTRPSPRGSRHVITLWKWQPRPERQMTQAHRRPKLMPAGKTSQRSSAPPPRKTLMSTWTTSFQFSMEAPGRGAKCSVASSTRLTGFSAPTRSWTLTVNTPSPERSRGKNMGPAPPVVQSSGGTSTN